MSWQPAKPADADLVFNSIGSTAIRGDFSAIDTAWDINHVGIGDTYQGKHTTVHLREVSTPTTLNNEIALYCQDPSYTLQGSELFIRRESNGAGIPATAAYFIAGSDTGSTQGWTFLPSGILLKWGTINTAGGDQSFTFATGTNYVAFSEVYRAFLTPRDSANGDSDVAIRLKSVTTTTMSYYGSPRTTTGAKAMTFDYLVIGRGA
jgi:hypothetical protein